MALDQELSHFERIKSDLIKNHNGKFALIKGDQFIDAFDNATYAYEEGVKRFGREPFLVKIISETEEVYRNQALFSGLAHARI